jgi:phage antirepressor YoqD-like protein
MKPGCTIAHFAATLNHNEQQLVLRMRVDGILQQFGRPYQDYVNRGYFRVMGSEEMRVSVELTSKGQIWLARKYPPGMDLTGDGA